MKWIKRLLPLFVIAGLFIHPSIDNVVYAHPTAPTIESSTDIAEPATVSFNVNLPPGTVAGNLLLAIIAKDDDDAMASSHGFTEAFSIILTKSHGTWCWYKIVVQADVDRTYVIFTGDSEGYVGRMYRITGFDSGTPIDVVDATGATGESDTPQAPSVDTVTDDALVFATTGMDDNDVPYSLDTAGWTTDVNTSVVTAGIVIGYKTLADAGSTGAVDFTTGASDGWAATQIAIRPAGEVAPPTITTSVATNIEATTATLNGNVVATGGDNPTVTVYWGDNDGGEIEGNWDYNSAPTSPSQPQGVATFYKNATSLLTGTTIYFNAKGTNSGGTDWGTTQSFLTKPVAPTSVDATDGSSTENVTITWAKSTGAIDYQVYRDATPLGWLGDVATYNDTGADAPTITPGSTIAADGSSTDNVSLSLSETNVNDGTIHTYKVRAKNATGESVDSTTDNGYRGHGALTYQWQKSSGDSDADYSNIDGATSSTYDDTAAPAPTITPGTASASDGTNSDYVTLSLAGELANEGAGRYYRCVLNANGCTQQTSASNRGNRGVGALTYQWQRSEADSDANYSNIVGGIADPYNDSGAPADGSGRYFQCVLDATGASQQTSTADRGYRGTIAIPTVTTTANATSISFSSGTVSGNITDTGGQNADYRGFEWGDVIDNYTDNWTDAGSFGVGGFSHNITGLSDNTTYFFRAMAHNDGGWGYGTGENFTTLMGSDTPPVVVTNVEDNLVDSNGRVHCGADLHGNVTSINGTEITDRGFVWAVSHYPNPGDTAPGDTLYTYYWTESGSFGTGTFEHTITGLTGLTYYYFRACAYNDDEWGYGEERVFFVKECGKVYIEIRPDLSETRIRGNAGIPTDALVGVFHGYSMALWNENDEELFFLICVPDRWDEESQIIVHVKWCTSDNETNNIVCWEMGWDYSTPNIVEAIPTDDPPYMIQVDRAVGSELTYAHYQEYFIIDYDIDASDPIIKDDLLALRLRRISVNDSLTGEPIVLELAVLFARGDYLADPTGNIMTIINNLIAIDYLLGGANVVLLALVFLALGLTIALFATRNSMLGFPAALFWAILGGYAYTQSTTAWGDWQFYLAFASLFGMVIFTALAAFGLREKRDTLGDEAMEEEEERESIEEEEKPSRRTRELRGRAEKRRTRRG